jgi:hypothetical protein
LFLVRSDQNLSTTDGERLSNSGSEVLSTPKGLNAGDEEGPSEETEDASEKIMKEINQLKNEIAQGIVQIYNITGSKGDNSMSYSDDWCRASEDLDEASQLFAEQTRKEMFFVLGDIDPPDSRVEEFALKMDVIPPDIESSDGYEHIRWYESADRETIEHLAAQDDVFALRAIVKDANSRFDSADKDRAARKLLLHGDTKVGLQHLIYHYLAASSTDLAFDENNSGREMLINALIYLEFSMLRGDFENVGIYARYLQSDENIRKVVRSISSDEYKEVTEQASQILNQIERRRSERGLPSLDELVDEKIVSVERDISMFFLHDLYPDFFNDTLLSPVWQREYLKETDCLRRQLAMDSFLVNEVPKIGRQIEKLQDQLP